MNWLGWTVTLILFGVFWGFIAWTVWEEWKQAHR